MRVGSKVIRGRFFASGSSAPGTTSGGLAFNPAAEPGDPDYGMLYFSIGDGGSAFDPEWQRSGSVHAVGGDPAQSIPCRRAARLIRFPPTTPSRTPRRRGAGNLGRTGIRHAQHFSFSSDGTMYINDIGQNQVEEVNVGRAGGNYGWNVREGTFVTGAGIEDGYLGYLYPLEDTDDGFEYPIAQYDHDDRLECDWIRVLVRG